MHSKLHDYINFDDKKMIELLNEILMRLKAGTVAESIISAAAEKMLKNTLWLRKYIDSPEYSSMEWGNKFARIDDQIYYITSLRNRKVDFDTHPFNGFSIEGIKSYRFKYKVSAWEINVGGDKKFSWEDVKKMQVVLIPADLEIVIKNRGKKNGK